MSPVRRVARRAQPRFGFFVEGANNTSRRGWDDLRALWQNLCDHFGVTPDRVDVHGFSKAQIVAMAQTPPGIQMTTRLPLDAIISVEHGRRPFDILVVAFDARPPNQNLLPKSCLRTEVNFVLNAFAQSQVMPEPFVSDAAALMAHYEAHPRTPRGPGRPPRTSIDAIYMDPMFDALVLTDQAAWRRIFGLRRVPKDWPSMKRSDGQLDQLMVKMIKVGCLARSTKAPPYLNVDPRVDPKANKHAFALEAVRNAGHSSPLWRHSIATRIAEVLA